MIKPARKAPSLVLPTVYHGEFNLFNEDPKNFTMVIFIRGLHCPLCINYLKELTTFLPTLNDLGVDYIISSADDKTRATQMLQKVGSTELRFAYNLDIEKAKEWDLYISKGRIYKFKSSLIWSLAWISISMVVAFWFFIEDGSLMTNNERGVAFLAGLATGFWKDISDLKKLWIEDLSFHPDTSFKSNDIIELWQNRINRLLKVNE